MSIENKKDQSVTFQEFHQRPSIGQHSVSSEHFRRLSITSTPKRRTSTIQFVVNTGSGMLMTSSRQEFLPGEPNGGVIRYSRRGGVFISKWGILSLILGILVLVTVVGLLVYFYAPCRDEEKSAVEDDLSWNIGELHIRTADDTVRLLSNVKPSYYRIKIKPNLTSFTFEGKVSITLSTNKTNVKHIALHAKNLEILNGTVLTEQNALTSFTIPKSGPKRKKRSPAISAEVNNAPQNIIPLNGELQGNASEPKSSEDLSNSTTTNTTIKYEEVIKRLLNATEEDAKANATLEAVKPEVKAPTVILTQSKNKRMKIISKELNPSIDRLIFTLDSHIKANINYTLEISFKGKIDDSLHGFYRSTYRDITDNTTRALAVTQFEPTSARKAFPCFDEPEFKAMFEISIARNKSMKVISNMPLQSEEEDPKDAGLIWSHFERSLPMSPYLVAYAVSDLDALPTNDTENISNNTVPYKVWARKELLSQTAYAIEFVPRILNFFINYFGVPYALPKMDLVAIPDFAVGAMENWGMLTFRETSLVLDPVQGSIKTKKGVAMVIAHEIAHQWFGNLVTMKWWNDLWLNEGFATYMEYIGVNEIEPEWGLLDQFSLDRMYVLSLDSIQSTRPVSALVNDETQISQIFDEISYMKAASLLNMLNFVLSKEVFHNGLLNYMTKWKYKNADQNDLWKAFTLAAANKSVMPEKVSVANFMDSWTLEAGYPVINVTRNYETGVATVTQNRFYLYLPATGVSNQLWYVPLTYAVGGTNFTNWTTTPQAWLEKTPQTYVTLPSNANTTWIYFNVMSIGHYRVNYDMKNWKYIEYGLDDAPEEFPPVARGQILDDAFNLARAGQLNYTVPLGLTKYMIDIEKHYLPWFAVLDNLNLIHFGMQKTSKYGLFQEYISRLIMPTLKFFGYAATPGESTQDAILRDRLIYWACLVEEPECIDWVREQFNGWMNEANPDKVNPIPANSRVTVYTTALRMGSKKEFDFLLDRLQKSNDPEAISEIVASLPSTRNTWQLYSLLEYSITLMDIQMTPILWSGFESDLASQIAFKFVCGNWDRIYARYAEVDDQILPSIIDGAFNNIGTEQELRQYKRFIRANKEQLSSVSKVVYRNVEGAVLRIQWGKTRVDDIEKWLIKFAETKSTSVNEFSTLYGNLHPKNGKNKFATANFMESDKDISVIPLYMG